jgi:hypothetical protein
MKIWLLMGGISLFVLGCAATGNYVTYRCDGIALKAGCASPRELARFLR